MGNRREEAGELQGALWLFLKVTKSYWKGLFHCYRFPEGTLPRTNNDLEHPMANGVPAAEGTPRPRW